MTIDRRSGFDDTCVSQLAHWTTPWFLILMVPVFGIIRFASYRSYLRLP